MSDLKQGRIFPIGFHLGPGGNADGLKRDFLTPLDNAGIRFFIVSADAYPWDAAEIRKSSTVDHTVVYRISTKGQDDGYQYDVPDYSKSPSVAADEHFEQCMRKLPQEYHMGDTVYSFLNEVDKNRSDWLGWFCLQWLTRANEIGLMTAGLGFSSGEPEYEHWLTPGMSEYLKAVSRQRDRHMVAIHEYSYDVNDIWNWYPNLVGRYARLMDACDALGIDRVPFIVKEFGWEYQNVPAASAGIPQMEEVALEYVKLQENYGAGTWWLGPGFNSVANKLQPYIAPLGQLALDWGHYVDWDNSSGGNGGEPPPQGDNMFSNPSFEEGTYKWGGINEINIPNDWEFAFSPDSVPNPIDSNPWSKWQQPEVVNPGKENLPAHEQDLFVLDGNRTLKIFKGSGSIRFEFFDGMSLEKGTYTVRMPVFADLVKAYTSDGQKIWADDPNHQDGMYKVMFGDKTDEDWTPLVPGQWNIITATKTLENSSSNVPVGVEIMLPFALQNNGVFMDDFSMVAGTTETEKTLYQHLWDVSVDQQIAHGVSLNPQAALQAAIFNHANQTGQPWVPVATEVYTSYGGQEYALMPCERVDTGARLVFYAPVPDWGNIRWFSEGDTEPTGPFEFKVWPSASLPPYVTQYWGANPQNYAQYGLPGHDGVDIRAPEGTRIYAVADGEVYRVETNPSASNYGIHVRIKHQDGYKTIYGHASQVSPYIYVGRKVSAGEWIMDAGNTGNSFGAHLHMGLKREGYTYTDKDQYGNTRTWPYNLHDPTQFLKELCGSCFPGGQPPPAGLARLGLHASADAGLASGEASMFAEARVEIVKHMSNLPPQDCSKLAGACPGAPFVIRVFQDGWNRPGGITPGNFIDWNTPDVQRYMPILQGRTIYIELHNEPNLTQEGWQHVWQDGAQFANWLMPVIADFRKTFPSAHIVFPGLSPGGDVGGIRYDNLRFVQGAAQAVNACDVLGVHVYWQKDLWPMSLALDQLDAYRRIFPGKPIIITESSNNRATVTQQQKGQEYILFWQELRRRADVIGVTYFVSSASNPIWGWNGGTGEVWHQTAIPGIVGSR